MRLNKVLRLTFRAALTGVFVGVLLGGPVFAKDELPEVDSDGLHLVKKTKVRAAYIKPGTDLSQYSKVMLIDCYVDFVKDWQKDYNLEPDRAQRQESGTRMPRRSRKTWPTSSTRFSRKN